MPGTRVKKSWALLLALPLAACVEAQAPLSLFEPARASLHEAFVALVGEDAASEA